MITPDQIEQLVYATLDEDESMMETCAVALVMYECRCDELGVIFEQLDCDQFDERLEAAGVDWPDWLPGPADGLVYPGWLVQHVVGRQKGRLQPWRGLNITRQQRARKAQ